MMRSAFGTLTVSARNPVTGKLALGTTSGIVILYDVDRGIADARTLSEMRGHPVNALIWSPNGIFIASAHQQGFVGIWHAASGRCVLQGQVDKKNCPALSWSRGGAFLVVACTGKQEVAVYPESEITLEQSIESGHVVDMDAVDPIFQWKGGKGNLVMGNFAPDDLHFAFSGGNPIIQFANTAEWKITSEIKVPIRPSFIHWVDNDHLLVAGIPEKAGKTGEDHFFLVEFPSGKVLLQQQCGTIQFLRVYEREKFGFLLQELGQNKRLGFQVIDLLTLRIIGEITPDVPDIFDVILLSQQKKVAVVTSTGLLLGEWNGHDGSNYELLLKL